jgi:predicted MPP superfamily phosphohydrolase
MEQMKVLLTAALHFRLDWFRWLIEQVPNYDLVCIVGDLLDMFEVKSAREQACEVTGLIKRLADIVPVAVCSGNHDNAGGLERTLRVLCLIAILPTAGNLIRSV